LFDRQVKENLVGNRASLSSTPTVHESRAEQELPFFSDRLLGSGNQAPRSGCAEKLLLEHRHPRRLASGAFVIQAK
jgi:hypothetical protein